MKLIKHTEVDADFTLKITDLDLADMYFEHGIVVIMTYNNETISQDVNAKRLELHIDLSLPEPIFQIQATQDGEHWFEVGTLELSQNEVTQILWWILTTKIATNNSAEKEQTH